MEAVKLLLRAIEKWVDNKYAKLLSTLKCHTEL
jgi:hypothetical protein